MNKDNAATSSFPSTYVLRTTPVWQGVSSREAVSNSHSHLRLLLFTLTEAPLPLLLLAAHPPLP